MYSLEELKIIIRNCKTLSELTSFCKVINQYKKSFPLSVLNCLPRAIQAQREIVN